MNVFITGVAGFLGSNLAEALVQDGHVVSGCDNLIGGDRDNVPEGVTFYEADCGDYSQMRELLPDIDALVHCAATAYEGLSVFSPSFVTDNVFTASVAVFSAAIANDVTRIVFCSSMARYGSNKVPFLETYQPLPQDPYGIAKVAAEDVLKNLAEVHGCEYVIAVPHNIIGPKQKFNDPYRNVAAIMINRMLKGLQPIIYGDGEQMRCFSFVDECVACLKSMLTQKDVVGEVINIGPDSPFVSINDLAIELARQLDFPLDPIHVPGRPQEVRYATCSADKARSLLGYEGKVSLAEGLAAMIEFIRSRGPKPFSYELPIEIVSAKTPKTWLDRII